jgi:proteasome accessory factor BC
VALGITGAAGGHELSQRLAKIETAIFRRKTIVFEYYTMERGEWGTRKVDPYHLLFQPSGQFYLIGHSHERKALRVFRLSRIRGKVGYATKAEHDFQRPGDFDPRAYANRIDWQFGDPVGTAEVWIGRRIAWQIERHFGRYGEMRPAEEEGDRVFVTPYANARQLIAWVLGLGEHARIQGPPELADELRDRLELLIERHSGDVFPIADPGPADPEGGPAQTVDAAVADAGNGHHPDGAIRPERFARLVTLASILIEAGRAGRSVDARELVRNLKVSEQELREDISVLNLVNFGAGTYVLYAELGADGKIEVEPEPYGDSFARPARLLPVEAKALVAAIDLIGEHIPEGSLTSVRQKVVGALGEDPVHEGLQIAAPGGDDTEIAAVVSRAIAHRRMLSFEYYKENEDEFSTRMVEPYALINGREGWYVASYDPSRSDVRHFRLDRFKSAAVTDESFEPRPDVDPAADVDGWPRTGEVPAARRARVWISPERARWAREERTVTEELEDGAVIVERGFASMRYLVRDVLKEAGDAVVLEPDDARAAVRGAADAIRAASPVATA